MTNHTKVLVALVAILLVAIIVVIICFACGVFSVACETAAPCAPFQPCVDSNSCTTVKRMYEELLPINRKLVEDMFDGCFKISYRTEGSLFDNIYFRFHKSTSTIKLYRVTAGTGKYESNFEELESANCKFKYSFYEKEGDNVSRFQLKIEIPEGQSLRLAERYNYLKKLFLPNSTVVLQYIPRLGRVIAYDNNDPELNELFDKDTFVSIGASINDDKK